MTRNVPLPQSEESSLKGDQPVLFHQPICSRLKLGQSCQHTRVLTSPNVESLDIGNLDVETCRRLMTEQQQAVQGKMTQS